MNFLIIHLKYLKHSELIDIKFEKHQLTKIWENIKFKINSLNIHIKDVSMLGNVYELNLTFCRNIKDISMLCNVYELNLSGCNGITDVSMLGNIHTLILDGCD